MTVAIGLLCSDGAVVASDSMGSLGPSALSSIKVGAHSSAPAVWTGAGSEPAMNHVSDALEAADLTILGDANKSETEAAELIGQIVRDALLKAYDSYIPEGRLAKNSQGAHPLSASTLLLGMRDADPVFIHVDPFGSITRQRKRGSRALGSGTTPAVVAQALMAHYVPKDGLSLELGKLLAYRTIAAVIETSSVGVGPPVQMAVASNGPGQLLSQTDVDAVRDSVEGWKVMERETLLNAAAPSPEGTNGAVGHVDLDEVDPNQ